MHLQTVLKKFNAFAASNKKVLIWYFRNSLKPSLQAQTNKRSQDLDTWKKAIKKAINAKSKAARQLQFLMRDMDSQFLKRIGLPKPKSLPRSQKILIRISSSNSQPLTH